MKVPRMAYNQTLAIQATAMPSHDFVKYVSCSFSWFIFYSGSFKIAFSAPTPTENGFQYSLRWFFGWHAFVHCLTHYKWFSFMCLQGRSANRHAFCTSVCFLKPGKSFRPTLCPFMYYFAYPYFRHNSKIMYFWGPMWEIWHYCSTTQNLAKEKLIFVLTSQTSINSKIFWLKNIDSQFLVLSRIVSQFSAIKKKFRVNTFVSVGHWVFVPTIPFYRYISKRSHVWMGLVIFQ